MARKLRPQAEVYRRVFMEVNGDGPWPCYFCGFSVFAQEEEYKLKLSVHHLDENPENQDPANLRASHFGCHSHHHAIEPRGPLTESHRRNISAAKKGYTPTEEARRKQSQSLKQNWAERKNNGR